MNRSLLFAGLATLLLGSPVAARASNPAASATLAATAAPTKNPIPPPPQLDPDVERTLTAMHNASTWGHPDLFGEFAGMQLYSEGRYTDALHYFKYGARYADKLSQLSIGLMYANGQGVDKDPVRACAWLALAAERKFTQFVATRDRVCSALTSAQRDAAIAELDKLLPEYGDKVAKRRMATALQLAKMQTTGSSLGFDAGVTQANIGGGGHCGGPAVAEGGLDVPIAGCADSKFYDASRWDPKQYFAARDARWRGTVTVGPLQDVSAAHEAARQAASGDAQPAAASSAGH